MPLRANLRGLGRFISPQQGNYQGKIKSPRRGVSAPPVALQVKKVNFVINLLFALQWVDYSHRAYTLIKTQAGLCSNKDVGGTDSYTLKEIINISVVIKPLKYMKCDTLLKGALCLQILKFVIIYSYKVLIFGVLKSTFQTKGGF